MRRKLAQFALFLLPLLNLAAGDGRDLASRYADQVTRRLQLPPEEQWFYAAEVPDLPGGSQYVAVVDRNPNVQAFLLYWKAPDGRLYWIGASPVSTGRPGRYDYFETPLGVFEHTVGNQDFRAEGTKNENGIRGYGKKGMRIFDFGWVVQKKGWGDHREILMRLQMHATDPDLLEPRLGTAGSKGCIRIPASLNEFLDGNGILDADYQLAVTDGKRPLVLLPEWRPAPWAGRFLVIVDSARPKRPAWAVEARPGKK